MHTDALFYRLFQERPATVFELTGLPYDQNAGYRLSAVEVKQTAFRLDGLLAPAQGTSDAPVIFVEAQFQPKPDFYARWFAAIFLYLFRHDVTRPWRAVVVYPDRGTDQDIPPAYAPLADAGLLHRVFLTDFLKTEAAAVGVRLARLVLLDRAKAAAEARALATTAGTQAERFEMLDLIETILVYKFPTLTREEIKTMLHLPDTDLKQTRFYQEVFAEGQKEGREEGAQRAETSMLLRLVKRRFDQVPPGLPERITALTSAQRGELSEALFDFNTPSDLEAWLREHPAPKD
jgi:predicted transposase/invertase (TIGR01784 family)